MLDLPNENEELAEDELFDPYDACIDDSDFNEPVENYDPNDYEEQIKQFEESHSTDEEEPNKELKSIDDITDDELEEIMDCINDECSVRPTYVDDVLSTDEWVETINVELDELFASMKDSDENGK